MSRILVLLIVFGVLFTPHEGHAQKKRALLVGINDYTPAASSENFALRKWKNLEGAVNDVEAISAILQTRLGFDSIELLRNQDATRSAIFSSIERLAAESQPGDVVLFYYAGHGSQMKNTASREADGLDETIVPYDVTSGAPDIRDKELRDAFNAILDRGALVTLIFDSCHSGSITRGIPGGQTRYLAPSPLVVSDDSNPPRPEDRGALVLSAAQDDELASELLDADGKHRGAFSWALGQALLSGQGSASANSVFLQLRALMKSKGMKQEPVIVGNEDRMSQPLFGGASSESNPHQVLVASIDDKDIFLQGGLATGIREGTELISDAGARYVVEQNLGMSQSIAVALEGAPMPTAGEALTIDKFVPSASSPLRVHVPPATLDYATLEALATDWDSLNPILDPTEQVPNHILYFDTVWHLLTSSGEEVDLGPSPSAKKVKAALVEPADGSSVVLFISYPPFDSFGDRLQEDLATAGRETALIESFSDAEYLLAGIWSGGEFKYAWILRESTQAESNSPAPPRTDWRLVTLSRLISASLLTTDLGKLDVIWSWINLQSPPGDKAFPYEIAGFKNTKTGEMRVQGDSLTLGEQYNLVLKTTSSRIQDAQMNAVITNVGKRYLYVFALDRDGNGTLLYPTAQDGNVENDINFFTSLPLEMTIPSQGALFNVTAPVGVDSFFLLSSAEALPQPDILTFSGVRTRSTPDGEQTDLSKLLFGLGGSTRSIRQPVPLNWSLEKITVRSIDNP
ncbi:caspase family protein [bacterium]|nr:caspase family protein [bacterium]